MDWRNNEDAGDLRAFADADYYAEMEAERCHRRREVFTQEWDREMAMPLTVYILPPGRPWYDREAVQVQGPIDLPWCEECCARVRRDNTDANYHSGDGAFFCSEDCRESYDSRPVYYEGREFPSCD